MLVYGWGKDKSLLGFGPRLACDRCKNSRNWESCYLDRYAELYFIKITRWAQKVIFICPACEHGFEIEPAKQRELLEKCLPFTVKWFQRLGSSSQAEIVRLLVRLGHGDLAFRLHTPTAVPETGTRFESRGPRRHTSEASYFERWLEGGSPGFLFLSGTLILCAKLAKSDGLVTASEIKVVQKLLNLNDKTIKSFAPLFNKAKTSDEPTSVLASLIARCLGGKRDVLKEILRILVIVAWSDENIHVAERDSLYAIAKEFGLDQTNVDDLIALHDPSRCDDNSTDDEATPFDAWGVLGVPHTASFAEVKAAYRRKAKKFHPDKVASEQVLQEHFSELLHDEMKKINAAYATLRKHFEQNAK